MELPETDKKGSQPQSDTAIARSLTRRYAVALLLVASLASAAWLSLKWVISEQTSTAAVVNVSGRQRMLSQRTALFSNLLRTAPAAQLPAIRANLEEAIALMARSHSGLVQGDETLGLPGRLSPAARALYFDGPQALDLQVKAYISAVQRLLQRATSPAQPDDPDLAFVTQTATGPLLQALDNMVLLHQQEGETRVAQLQRLETLFWLLTLLLLGLEAALIFRPVTRYVQRMIGQLQLANLKLQRQQDQLADLVQQRTHELQLRADALAEREEKFRLISTAADEAVLIIGPDDKLVYCNPAAERLSGYSQQALLGQAIDQTLMPTYLRDNADIGPVHSQAPQANALPGRHMDAMARRQNGSEFPVSMSLSSIQLGQTWHTLAILRDISHQKRVESELRIASTAFNIQMGMAITDAKNVILRVNKAFTDITGYRPDEVLGRNPNLLSSGRHDKAFYQTMFESIAQTGMWAGEIWNRHKDGGIFPEWLTVTAVKDEAGVITNYVSAFSDISERKAAENQIRSLAFYDPLTDLPNRRLLMDRLELAMMVSSRTNQCSALLFIDLDNFKSVNDTLGHHVGDDLLRQVAKRLSATVRSNDTVARLGGDEFVIMLESLGDNASDAAQQADTIGQKVLATLDHDLEFSGVRFHSTASIGVAMFCGLGESIDELLKRADLSMYEAKAGGRNALRFFDPQVQAAVEAKAAMEVALRLAIEQGQLVVYYQLQVDARGLPVGAEALVRWMHPQRGLVSPLEFIDLAEQSGLILPLGAFVLDTACQQLATWHRDPELAHLTLAVNVSAKQFHQTHFVDEVLTTLLRTGADPNRLKLELTESLLVDNINDVIVKMKSLKTLGVGFSLDDFGTGYSSLAYLSRLPLDQLKIDQGFVRDIQTSDQAAAICAATIGLAHSLKIKVVAEGVETEAQRYFLSDLHHCDMLQGYLFGKPMPIDDFESAAMRLIA